MVNINLSTSKAVQIDRKDTVIRGGLVLAIVVFVVIAVIYSGLFFWKNSLDDRIVVSESSYQAKYSELTTGRSIAVIDLKNRIFISKGLVGQSNEILDILNSVEKNIVSGVYIDTYESNKRTKTLSLKCIADNYDAVARQLLSFKGLSDFSEVSVGSASVSDDGKVDFLINIKLK